MLLGKNKSLLIFLLLTLSTLAFAQEIKKDKFGNTYYEQTIAPKKDANKFVILYTADPHGDNVEENIPRIFSIKKQLRQQPDAVSISIHGGDEPMDWPWAFSKHRGMYELWAKWDAYGLGNHDIIHWDLKYLLSLMKEEKLQIIATNVINKKGGGYLFPRYKIIKYNGSKILIVSLLTQVVNKDSRVNDELYAEKPSDSYNSLLAQIRSEHKDIDKIVAIYHAEYESFDKNEGLNDFLKNVSGKKLLILKAHEHEVANQAMIAKDGIAVPILSGGTANKNVKEVLFYYNPGSEEVFTPGITKDIDINVNIPEDAETSKFIKDYKRTNPLPPEYKWLEKKIFDNNVEIFSADRSVLNGKTHDPSETMLRSPLTAFIGDAFRHQMNTNFSLLEGTTIRRGISKGPVTGMDILRTLPYRNKLVMIELSGSELEMIVNEGFTKWDRKAFFSGMKIVYDATEERFKITDIYDTEARALVKFEYNKVYKGTCIDHVADVHDLSYKFSETGAIDSYTMIDYIRQMEKTGNTWELRYQKLPEYCTVINRPNNDAGKTILGSTEDTKVNAEKDIILTDKNKEFKTQHDEFFKVKKEIETTMEEYSPTLDKKLFPFSSNLRTQEEIDLGNALLKPLFSKSNDIVQEIYDKAGVSYEISTKDFGNGFGRVTYIHILPTGTHYLNKFAKFLKRFNVDVIFSQRILATEKLKAFYHTGFKMFGLSENSALLLLENKDASIHEMLHSFFVAMFDAGYDSRFAGYIYAKGGSINPDYGDKYEKTIAMDELVTYSENIASASRKLYRTVLALYSENIPELKEIEQVLKTKLDDASLDKLKLYSEIKDLVTIFYFSSESEYKEKRDVKLSEKVKEYFGGDVEGYQKFMALYEELYLKGNIKTNLPTVNNSGLNEKKLMESISLSADLWKYLVTYTNVARKLNYAINRVYIPLSFDYVEITPEEGFDVAYRLAPSSVLQYQSRTGVQGKYYFVSITSGNLEYHTAVKADGDVLTAIKSKLEEQAKITETFSKKIEVLKASLHYSPLLPSLKKEFPDDKEADAWMDIEEHLKQLKKMDLNSLDLKEIFELVLSIKDQAEAIRADYKTNIADGIDTWGDLIKQHPVKEETKVTPVITEVSTKMTEAEIKQAENILLGNSNNKDIDGDIALLERYLEDAKEKGLNNIVVAIEAYLSNYKKVTPSNIFSDSYLKIENPEFKEQDFKNKILEYAKVDSKDAEKYTTEELVARCFKKLVDNINSNWQSGMPVTELLTTDEVDLLTKDYSLLSYVRDRAMSQPVGSEARRAGFFCMETMVDLVSSEERYTEFRTEFRYLVDKEKIKDPVYKELYDNKGYSEKFKMMKDLFKEVK